MLFRGEFTLELWSISFVIFAKYVIASLKMNVIIFEMGEFCSEAFFFSFLVSSSFSLK